MRTTRQSLLLRVRDLGDLEAWDQFYGIYAPLILRFARRQGLSIDDAEEIRDDCLGLLARKMPGFAYDPSAGRFKSWLYRLAHGRVVDLRRRKAPRAADEEELAAVVDPAPGPRDTWEQLWRAEHLRYCVEAVRGRVSERNYAAFRMLLDDGLSVPEVCAATAMNANQVYKAKMQVLQRVRELMRRLDV